MAEQQGSVRNSVSHILAKILSDLPVQVPDDVDALSRTAACKLANVSTESCKYWISIGLMPDKRHYNLADVKRLKALGEVTSLGIKPSGLLQVIETMERTG